MDHPDQCFDRKHWHSYQYQISYDYNSRGFRDSEWPSDLDQLQNSIWCIGDSFTVGLGSPIQHTWPARLSALTGRKTINVSMDGASNSWIARQAACIIENIRPESVIVMWSFSHRREINDPNLTDEQRRSICLDCSQHDNWQHFLSCVKLIKNLMPQAIQLAIPHFHPEIFDMSKNWNNIKDQSWPDCPKSMEQLNCLPLGIQQELQQVSQIYDLLKVNCEWLDTGMVEVNQLDKARDGFHFDLKTADWVAAHVVSTLDPR